MKIKEGQYIEFQYAGKTLEGLIINKEKDLFFIKLSTGYNIGLPFSELSKAKIKGQNKKLKESKPIFREKDFSKKNILLLHMGGTIASRVDYSTGAVYPSFNPEDILALVPEKIQLANFDSILLENILSENMTPILWQKLAEKISLLQKKYNGIIVSHGTDTLGYTASALAFALNGISIPVLLVGAQRSSDRPSTEAVQNLGAAIDLILSEKFSGIGIVMNSNLSEQPALFPPTKTRKLHTSRRDAFCPVNSSLLSLPLSSSATFSLSEKFLPKTKFSDSVILIKSTPFLSEKFLLSLKNYKAIIIEGTGFGHIKESLIPTLKTLSKKTKIIMTSQCIFGITSEKVYSTARLLEKAGVIYAKDMLAETALVKASWLLANKISFSQFTENLCNEINPHLTEKNSNPKIFQ